jgi:hypothetical protein
MCPLYTICGAIIIRRGPHSLKENFPFRTSQTEVFERTKNRPTKALKRRIGASFLNIEIPF